jgi:hypothetical protein
MPKLTEDEVVLLLIKNLASSGWVITSFCTGQQKGCDIIAKKGAVKLVIEAKGAKAGELSPTRKREYFSCGQVKNHLGEAIVKILTEKFKNTGSEYAIAHPNDDDIKRWIGPLIPFLKNLGVDHFWVSADGSIIKE